MLDKKCETVLEVRDLTKEYNNFSLNGINFTVQKGNVTGFIGINGAGKTTTIKSIAGLTIPSCGDIYFGGEKITSKNEHIIKDRVGFLLDGDYYYPELTLMTMKNIVARAYSNWNDKLFHDLIKQFELNPKQKISTLSKGMKIRFSLALALAHKAEILIMDEPTSGLDPLIRSELIDILKDLTQDGVSILLSSHITSDLEKIADDVALIHKGNVIFQQDIDTLRSSHFVVTGKRSSLTPKREKLFLKTSETKDNFKGVYSGDRDTILSEFASDSDCNVSDANMEDIMLGYVFRDKKYTNSK